MQQAGVAQAAEFLLSLGIPAPPSASQQCPEAGVRKGFPCLAGWKCGSRSGHTPWGAVPQSLLQDELQPWCKQSSCWLLPVPEPISLGINQPEPFQVAFSSLMLWKHRGAVLQQLRHGKDSKAGKGLPGLEGNKNHQLVGRHQVDVVAQSLHDSLVK